MSDLNVEVEDYSSTEYQSQNNEIAHNEAEQTKIISETCESDIDNLNSSKSDCDKSETEQPKEDPEVRNYSDVHTRKRTSSNISDILNLGEENSNDNEVLPNPESSSNEKNLPSKRNTEKYKHRSGSKKRSRRFRKRKWKPYCKLTWEEQQKVHARDSRKAQRIRDELTALGIALAPDNTNEFLIKDQMISSPDYDEIYENKPTYTYYDKDFEEEYENMKWQYYSKLTKSELVQNWIEREDEIEVLEKQLNAIREQKKLIGTCGIDCGMDISSGMAKIEVFKKEIRNLMVENGELYEENERIRKLIEKHHLQVTL